MIVVFVVASMLSQVAVRPAAAQFVDKFANVHRACLTDSAGTKFVISIDPLTTGTTVLKTPAEGEPTTTTYFGAIGAPSDPWPEGVGFANTMAAQSAFPSWSAGTSASWLHEGSSREDTMTFRSGPSLTVVFTSSGCDEWHNCNSAERAVTRHCWAGHETCCGEGTLSPQCLENGVGAQCCPWFKAAAVCNATQTCCGELGMGASSHAFCCGQGSTCCQSYPGYSGTGTCCAAGTTCCSLPNQGLCCEADEFCDTAQLRCSKGTPTSLPMTTTPAPVECIDDPETKCCYWHSDLVRCDAHAEDCCGAGPPDAANAFCCPAGACCLFADGSRACCQSTGTSSTCCQLPTGGVCCSERQDCDFVNNRCSDRGVNSPSSAPATIAPQTTGTAAAPATTPVTSAPAATPPPSAPSVTTAVSITAPPPKPTVPQPTDGSDGSSPSTAAALPASVTLALAVAVAIANAHL